MSDNINSRLSTITLRAIKLFKSRIIIALIFLSILSTLLFINYDLIKSIMSNKEWMKFTLDVIKIFLSTSLGAFAAFQIQNFQSNKKTNEQKYYSLLRTQASLISMRNVILNIKREYTEELFKNNEYYNIKKLLFKVAYPDLDYHEILLALKKDDIQELFNIECTERQFNVLVNLIHERNSTYDEFTAMIADKGKEAALWAPISSDLKTKTTPIPKIIDKTEQLLIVMIKSLRDLIKEYYPNKIALNLTDKIEIKEY